MDETIGEKGGTNDLRRTRIIMDQRQKKKEQEELEELEKKVKKRQRYVLIKTLPIIVGGTILDALSSKPNTNKEKREETIDDDIEVSPKERDIKQDKPRIITLPTKKKVTVYIPQETEEQKEEIEILTLDKPKTKNQEEKPLLETIEKSNKKEELLEEEQQLEDISLEEQQLEDISLEELDFKELPIEYQEKLERLKSRKIVDEYEKQLKDIRYELRKVIYDYDVVVDDEEKIIQSEEASRIIDRLTEIIDRLEELKRKIRIDNIDKYDDNYIYYLIEDYFQDFREGKLIEDIKDSPLYVMIADKIDEIDQKKDRLHKEVEEKKEELETKEEEFEELKKNYYSIERLNQELLSFQYDQEQLLQEIREKVRNATTVKERVETEVEGMSKQSKRLLRLLTLQMFLPGAKSAKAVASSTAAYLYFMNKVVKPKTVTKKYQVITVKDYSDEILNSIENIDSAIKILNKTSTQIDKMIKEVKEKYKDYIGVIPECDDILRNLDKVKREMEEKEYEMKKIKDQQEKELEKNNAKVKTIGEYRVN